VLTTEGISDFGSLQEALGRHGGSHEMAYVLFDNLGGQARPSTGPTLRSISLRHRQPITRTCGISDF
jgi:hypothetical protein